jgi:hypothetical protein
VIQPVIHSAIHAVLRRAIVAAATICASLTVLAPALLCSGCSSPAATASCPDAYPAVCPDAAPSFAAQVEPLIHTHCTVCHGAGQQVPLLQSHTDIMAAGSRIFGQLHICKMPPPPQAPLAEEDRQAIMAWLVCGALDN